MSDVLAPSEQALLLGDRFAEKKILRNVKLLDGETKVSAVDLGRTLLAVAVAANAQKGTLRLAPRKRKAILGALGMQKLWVEPGEATAAWPEGSLEARVAALAKKRPDAEDLLVEVLGEETHDAYVHAVDLVKQGLASRGLLDVEAKKALGLVAYNELRAPEALRAQASEAAVRDVLAAAERQPDVWKMLVADVKDAAARQTTAPDGPD